MTNTLLAIIIGMAVAVVGCRTTIVTPISTSTAKKMNRGAKIYITAPRDGNYGSKQYLGSGSQVATALEAAFARYADDVIVGGQADDDLGRHRSSEAEEVSVFSHSQDRSLGGSRDGMVQKKRQAGAIRTSSLC